MCVKNDIFVPYEKVEDYEEFHIDVDVINYFKFSKKERKRNKQDIMFKYIVSTVENICGYEMINSENNSFSQQCTQQFFFSIPTNSDNIMREIMAELESLMQECNMRRLFKVWMD